MAWHDKSLATLSQERFEEKIREVLHLCELARTGQMGHAKWRDEVIATARGDNARIVRVGNRYEPDIQAKEQK